MNWYLSRSVTRGRRVEREAGSVYLLALVVLSLLTVIGLSLSLTTQTELQIGATEGSLTRVLYAADSGVEVALARGLASADHSAIVFRLTDDGDPLTGSEYEFLSEVETSPFVPILDTACNLCEINDAGTYSENAFRRINHAVVSRAQRFGTMDGGTTRNLLAQKQIAGMIEVQPWRVTPSALFPINDPAQMAKIKF
jgi:hypothetical protein